MIHTLETTASSVFRDDWDRIDPESLLTLHGRRSVTTEFGFLLRHYWIRDSLLRYRFTTTQRKRNGVEKTTSQVVQQEMVQCDADRCRWRETPVLSDDWCNDSIRLYPSFVEKRVCTYNRSNQTFQVYLPKYPKVGLSMLVEPRLYAMLYQPVLPPLLPVPLGFQWHLERKHGAGVDCLDFVLESAFRQDGMTVLLIRKSGEFALEKYLQFDRCIEHPFRVRRKGMTAYALERSLVLEDRTLDEFLPDRADSPLAGMEVMQTRKLELCQDE